MTEDSFEPTPWWEFDHDEKPVPLAPDAEAELIVSAEREAIIREDTEPSLVTQAQLAAAASPPRKRQGIAVSNSAALVAVTALLVGCVAMFALGWSQGRHVAARADRPSSVSESTSAVQLGDSLISWSLINNNVVKGGEA